MTLFDAPAETPHKSRAMAFTVSAVVIVAAVLLWFSFRYYPEKRAAEHFFDALVAGDMAHAYQLWQPGPSYKMPDFLADWGPNGYYGPVKSYYIVRESSPRGASGVVVEAAVSPFAPMPDVRDAEKSRRTKFVSVWIEAKDKSFSFPP
ncbi:MAG TPA: hypothetical protein VHF01_15090 [Candidatus Acidoferrum sp.]|nr:hypothetical protein [Candidatus Acidoferrum sp.]